MTKTIEDIQQKLDSGDAVVLTAEELKDKLRSGEDISVDDVDVVTCGTSGVMSGTSLLLHLPVDEPGSFNRAKEVYLNGIPAYPGPCPNELLGTVDVMVYGTNHSDNDENYGGGFLIKDLLQHKDIEVIVIDNEDNKISTTLNIDDIPYARIFGTRMAFKNYTAFTNPINKAQKSIFNASPMEGPYNSLSFSGCGDINPLQNDPEQRIINMGTKVLLNGAQGLILGNGTRSSDEKPNLSIIADLKDMDPHYVGGFKTGMGAEVFDSVAVPIPVLDDDILENLKVLNKDIPLVLADIQGRHLPISTIDYTMWDNADSRPTVNNDACFKCIPCLPELYCPVNAFHNSQDGLIELNLDDCFGCGYCQTVCPRGVPSINLNKVSFEVEGKTRNIEVSCRQSDKLRALEIATQLKNEIIDGSFTL